MPNNAVALIKNNLIAILIHASMCVILYLPSVFPAVGFGSITSYPAIVIYSIIAFGVYFFAGRLFLHSTKNTLIDIFSVIVLAIILFMGAAFWYDSTMFFSLIPSYAPSSAMREIIISISQMPPIDVKIEYMNIFLSPFPSLALWIGMRTKQYAEDYIIRQQQSTLKNNLMSIVCNKKQSFILFIALICLAYLSMVIMFVITIILNIIGID